MQYAYAYQLNGTQTSGLDPSAKAYINAVVAAGATVSGTQRSAINTFVKTGKAAGWYSSLKRIYLPIWGVAAPNAICMTSLTSGTFVGTVTHGAGFASTDGTTGHFIFNGASSSLGLTTSSGSVFMLVTATSAIAGGTVLGRGQDGNSTRTGIVGGGGNIRALQVSAPSALTYTEADSRGILIASRTSTLTTSGYKRTSSGFTTTLNEEASTSTSVSTTTPMTIMASNTAGVVSLYTPSTVRFGIYGMGLGLTSAQSTDLSLSLKNLWETSTGLTLP
jgi:hypothetical protein